MRDFLAAPVYAIFRVSAWLYGQISGRDLMVQIGATYLEAIEAIEKDLKDGKITKEEAAKILTMLQKEVE